MSFASERRPNDPTPGSAPAAPAGAPIRAGPLKLRLTSLPVHWTKNRRQSTIARPSPDGLWENPTPFGQPFIRSMKPEWKPQELAIELFAQVAVDMLNSGDADPADPASVEAVKVGVGHALYRWQAGNTRWEGRWLQTAARSLGDPDDKLHRWSLTAAAAAARCDRYLMDHRHQIKLGIWMEGPPPSAVVDAITSQTFRFDIFGEGIWHGADGRLLERTVDHRDGNGEDSLFAPSPDRGTSYLHEERSLLALAVIALDPPPCERVREEALRQVAAHPIALYEPATWHPERGRGGYRMNEAASVRAILRTRAWPELPEDHPFLTEYVYGVDPDPGPWASEVSRQEPRLWRAP